MHLFVRNHTFLYKCSILFYIFYIILFIYVKDSRVKFGGARENEGSGLMRPCR